MAIHSSYLQSAFNPAAFNTYIGEAIKILTPRTEEFDAVAFRGFSGSLVAPIIAYTLSKRMIIVRKEPAHGWAVEGHDATNYLIIDDFISSGKTIRTIIEEIGKSQVTGKPVGIYLWKPGKRDPFVVDPNNLSYTIPIWSKPT